MGITRQTWDSYKDRGEDFLTIITRVEDIIWDQKFTGAAAGILNGNIIARELPLGGKEAKESESPRTPAFLDTGYGQGHHRTHGQHKGKETGVRGPGIA
nr:terminase small subunit [uncultured Cohaesibacter sp.]